MLFQIKFSWRNLFRNFSRSLLAGLSIALGLAMCIGTLGIMEGLNRDLVNGVTKGQVGHAQLHHQDYLSQRKLSQDIDDISSLTADIKKIEGVDGVAPRLYSWAYLSKDNKSVGVQLVGLEAAAEASVTNVTEKVIEGQFIRQPSDWREGKALSDAERALDEALTEQALLAAFDEIDGTDGSSTSKDYIADQTAAIANKQMSAAIRPLEAVIGSRLAGNLNATIGDRLSLFYESREGVQTTIDAEVVGIIKVGDSLVDRTRVILNYEDLAQMLQMKNHAHEIAISVDQPKMIEPIVRSIREEISSQSNVVVESWSSLRPDILALIASNEALMGTLVFIIFLISGVGVMNAMFVSVAERQKELSVMKALGVSAGKILQMIMLETSFLTGIAVVIGVILGFLLTTYLMVYGWDISEFGEFSMSGVGIQSVLRAEMTSDIFVIPLVSIGIISLLSAAYPAIKAARVSPAVGMRSA